MSRVQKNLRNDTYIHIYIVKSLIRVAPNLKTHMFLVSSSSCLCPIYWSQVLSWEWRCSWSSADRRCSNYIWVINNLIAHKGATYIKDLTVYWIFWVKLVSGVCGQWFYPSGGPKLRETKVKTTGLILDLHQANERRCYTIMPPLTAVYLKNFHDSWDICPMGFVYSIQICEISHQTFGPSHRKCPMCLMIFMNTVTGWAQS